MKDVGGGVPGHDPLGVHVDDERDVHEPGPRAAVGEVGDPYPVRGGSGEVALEQVRRALDTGRWDRGGDLLAAADPVAAQGGHEAVHGPTRDVVALAS
jgi:hypothetical protein